MQEWIEKAFGYWRILRFPCWSEREEKLNQEKHSKTKHEIKRINDEDDDENNFQLRFPILFFVKKVVYNWR